MAKEVQSTHSPLTLIPASNSAAQLRDSIVVIGKESTGKSQLVAALAGVPARSANFRGSTVACEIYESGERTFVDTPGIMRDSDSATTLAALARLAVAERVLLVAQATHLDDDLAELLPLARGKHGVVVVTFWDKVAQGPRGAKALENLGAATGLRFIPVDARNISAGEREAIFAALDNPAVVPDTPPQVRAGWRIEPNPTLLELPLVGPLLALVLLFLPAALAVWVANTFAGLADPVAQAVVAPLNTALSGLPAPLNNILIGRYGLVTMGPLLFVWAAPTVVLYALLLGSYKASGLLDRLTTALHPLLRPFGLGGRDLVRVLMGFGCNVPAVVSTRACSSCSRSGTISAIAFGSACSYQFGATVGVFAGVNKPLLVVPYLAYLGLTTLIYTRLVADPQARSPLNRLLISGRTFLEVPRPGAVWREARSSLVGFFRNALPIFLAICVLAALLDWIGVLEMLSGLLGPLMGAFRLPESAALPVVLASIRKDGILLFGSEGIAATLSAGQLLTGVYLAGVLLPCLVTALTIVREKSPRFVLGLMGRQVLAAAGFALLLSWLTALVGF